MAHFKNGIIGEVNGRIGNVVIRKMYGKNFVSFRPKHYKKSKSIEARSVRSKFAVQSKLASLVNRVSLLSEAWSQYRLSSISAFHKILKTNLAINTNEALSTKHLIVPPSSLSLISKLQFEDGMFLVSLENLSILTDESNSLKGELYIILVLYQSYVLLYHTSNFLHFITSIDSIENCKDAISTITINTETQFTQLVSKKFIAHAAAIWKNPDSSTLQWSKTYSQEFFS